MKDRDCKSGFSFISNLFRTSRLKQWKMLFALGVFLWIGVVGIPYSQAATIHVDCQSGTPDGSNGFYNTISAAVAAAVANDVIRVHAGSTCVESITINVNKTGLKIFGDNPTNTKVTHPSALASVDVFTISASSVEIAGLTITGSGSGIYINATSSSIHNNHINYNKSNGITSSSIGDNFIAFNNIIKGNANVGIYGYYSSGDFAYNNIVAGNTSDGISSVDSHDYNSTYANGEMDIRGTGGDGGHEIHQDCFFVNESANPPDFRLQNTSPCKKTGNSGYFNVDGTRSDMGSFGGPAAALFWPYGNGGPVVTNLTVDPPYVPEGGTISIKATVEIR